jgi:plastocyanin
MGNESHTPARLLRRVIIALAVMAFVSLAAQPSAAAPGTVVVANPFGLVSGYTTRDMFLPQGTMLQFFNPDPIPTPHNVTSKKTHRVKVGPGRFERRPVLASVMAGTGGLVPVTGTEKLEPGEYRFYCTMHPVVMRGTLTVQ